MTPVGAFDQTPIHVSSVIVVLTLIVLSLGGLALMLTAPTAGGARTPWARRFARSEHARAT